MDLTLGRFYLQVFVTSLLNVPWHNKVQVVKQKLAEQPVKSSSGTGETNVQDPPPQSVPRNYPSEFDSLQKCADSLPFPLFTFVSIHHYYSPPLFSISPSHSLFLNPHPFPSSSFQFYFALLLIPILSVLSLCPSFPSLFHFFFSLFLIN